MLKSIAMFKDLKLSLYIKYSILAAVAYCVPIIFFVRDSTFRDAWLLYLGNALFLVVISLFMLFFNKTKNQNAPSTSMLIAGHATTVMGILIACLLSFIILIIFVPGLFHSGTTEKVLTDAPANHVRDKTNGLAFMVFMNAIFGNVIVGSFSSIMLAFTVKRDQTKEEPLRKADLNA
jgi:hypothetical protein